MNSTLEKLKNCSFSKIADAYMELRKEGIQVSVEELAEALPNMREQILARIPSMILLDDTLGEKQNAEEELPKEIAGCRIESKVGQGATATVFRAYQEDLDRYVAVKVIEASVGRNASARIEQERRTLAKLEHPNIVQAYSYEQQGRFHYLITKFVDGYSLDQLITEKCDYAGRTLACVLKTDWYSFAEMGMNVADGLVHAHQQGVIHRDIKPSNLLIDKDGKVWITDFGLAKIESAPIAISQTGDVIGTPRFMAPEQMCGVCDARSDIYSLGLTLYCLAANSDTAIAPRINIQSEGTGLRSIRELSSGIPKDLAQVIMRACAFSPEDRYQTAEEMATVLRRFCSGRKADRRKGRRAKGGAVKRNLKVKVGVVTSLGVLATGFALHNPAAKQIDLPADPNVSLVSAQADTVNPVAPVKPRIGKGNTTMLDGLIDYDEEQIDDLVVNVVSEQLQTALDEIQVPIEEASTVRYHVEELLTGLEDNELPSDTIDKLVNEYRESSLSAGARFLRLLRVVERCGLNQLEKQQAEESIHLYAYWIVKEVFSRDEAITLEKMLTFDRRLNAEQLAVTTFSDDRLKRWLRIVRAELARAPELGDDRTVSNEIQKLFHSVEKFNESR